MISSLISYFFKTDIQTTFSKIISEFSIVKNVKYLNKINQSQSNISRKEKHLRRIKPFLKGHLFNSIHEPHILNIKFTACH